jgi:beta-lactam-binding protein with PASTA domain
VRPRRRPLRRPPPPDPYVVEEHVVVEPGRDPRWIFVWLLAIGVVAALLVFLLFATRDDDGDRRAAPRAEVPRVLGLDHERAATAVERAGLLADTFPVRRGGTTGIVVAQSPPPGTRLRRGSPVRLEVTLARNVRQIRIRIPNVVDLPAAQARALLRRADLTVRTIFVPVEGNDPGGLVVRQQPRPGTGGGVLTQVTLYVGR